MTASGAARGRRRVPEGRPLWALREDVRLDLGTGSDAPLLVHGRWGTLRVPDGAILIRRALDRMSLGPVALENVPGLDESYRAWLDGNGVHGAWRRVARTLDLLGGRVVPSLGADDGGVPMLSLVATRERVRFTLPEPPRDGVHLAGGTRLVARRRAMTLERPGGAYRAQLRGEQAHELVRAVLDRPAAAIPELADAAGLPEPTARDLVAYLAAAGLVVVPTADPRPEPVRLKEVPQDVDGV